VNDYDKTHPHKSRGGISSKKHVDQMNKESVQNAKKVSSVNLLEYIGS